MSIEKIKMAGESNTTPEVGEPNVIISPEKSLPSGNQKVEILVKPGEFPIPETISTQIENITNPNPDQNQTQGAAEQTQDSQQTPEATPGGPGGGGTEGGGGRDGGGNGEGSEGESRPEEQPASWWPEQLGIERWKELPAKARPIAAIHYYHNLPSSERRINETKQKEAYDRADSYAINDGLYSIPAEIADLKDELSYDDQVVIGEYTTRLQNTNDHNTDEKIKLLRDGLNDLDVLKRGLKMLDELLSLDQEKKSKLILTLNDWQALDERRENYLQLINKAEREISSSIGQPALDDRNSRITQIQDRERQLKELEEEEKLKAEEEEIAKKIETEQEPQLINEIIDENLPSFAETLQTVNQLKGIEQRDTNQQQQLETAEARMAWYFYKAKEFGLTADLDTASKTILKTYVDLFERVGMQALNNLTRDIEAVREGLITDRIWALRTLVAQDKFPTGVNPAKFNGTREAYMDNAHIQIEYQTQKILDPTMPEIEDMIAQGLIERLPGEFNVRDTEVDITLENRPHYQILYGTMVELTGQTEEDVDKGIDEYIDNLLYGSGTSDIQTVYGKMTQLGEAIERASLRIKFKELRPESSHNQESDFREKWANKRRQAFNRIVFPLIQYTGNNLDAPNNAGLLKRQALRDIDKDGYENYRELVKDPDVLLTILRLYNEYKLYYTPVGHKGQLINKTPAQYFLRGQLKELLIEDIMNMQFDGDIDRLTKTMTDLDIKKYFIKRESSIFEGLTLKQALDRAKNEFHTAETSQAKRVALKNLKLAKIEYYGRRKQAQAKVNLAIAVMDSLGESAQLGAPSVIMDNGDYIRIDDMNLVGKYAIFEAAEEIGDNPALIRWRQRIWRDAWKETGLNRAEAREIYKQKVIENYQKIGRQPPQFTFELKEGFEETGLINSEWDALEQFWKKMRKDGCTAVLGKKTEADEEGNLIEKDITFEDILKMDELKAVLNNFMSNYASARETALSPIAIREAKKGNDPHLLKTLKRLDKLGRAKFSDFDIAWEQGKLEELTPEFLKELFEDAISDSFMFNATVMTLTRHMATRPKVKENGSFRKDSEGNFVYITTNPLIDLNPNNYFTSDNLDFGFPGETWLFKRLRSYPEYLASNKRERVGRGIELLPWIDTRLTSLSEYLACDNIPELVWNFNKQFVDQWVLTTFPEQILSAQTWRQFGETSVNEENKAYFGLLDKILTDSDKLWIVFGGKGFVNWMRLYKDNKEEFDKQYTRNPEVTRFKEDVDNALELTLSRIQPLDGAQEKSLSQFRSAAGSGVGRELNELMALKIAEWVISEKLGSRREEGGALSYPEVTNIMKWVMHPDSWRLGTSFWEEKWGKMTNSRNPRLPSEPPITLVF